MQIRIVVRNRKLRRTFESYDSVILCIYCRECPDALFSKGNPDILDDRPFKRKEK